MVKLEAKTAPDGSTEEEARLRTNVDAIVANMLAANVAQKIFETDERIGKEYWVLATPNALEKRFIAVAVLGYPEQVGVWSYTLLGQSRVNETSMEPYFREFATHDFGLIAINPNFFAPDIEGSSFFYQLDCARFFRSAPLHYGEGGGNGIDRPNLAQPFETQKHSSFAGQGYIAYCFRRGSGQSRRVCCVVAEHPGSLFSRDTRRDAQQSIEPNYRVLSGTNRLDSFLSSCCYSLKKFFGTLQQSI